jgi:coenzyme F420 biosynthesis associated uncharacterized protein
VVDWGLAERTATTVAGMGGNGVGIALAQDAVDRACAEALDASAAYTRLAAPDPPAPELVDREAWIPVALTTLRQAAVDIDARLYEQLSAPRPVGATLRGIAGAATAIEAGIAVGYAARHVLGQVDVAVVGPPRPSRLLLVVPNIESVRSELDADADPFLRWIALHEATHVLQFQGVPWLEGHLRNSLAELIAGTAQGIDLRELPRRLLHSDPGGLVRSVLRGEIARSFLGDAQRRAFDRLQATMAVVEGHAEHVTGVCALRLDPAVARLGPMIEERRGRRGGLTDVIARLLGLELKLRQYRLGKDFCDSIAQREGDEALGLLWKSPASLPTLEELERPDAWLERVTGPRPAQL